MISEYLGLDCWKNEWDEAKKYLMPANDIFNNFLKNPNNYPMITTMSLCDGNSYNITWDTIFNYYVQDKKKFSLSRIGNATKQFFLDSPINEKNCNKLFHISVILCDSEDNDINEKAKKIILTSIENTWFPYSNKRDVLVNFEVNNVPSLWYKEYLSD